MNMPSLKLRSVTLSILITIALLVILVQPAYADITIILQVTDCVTKQPIAGALVSVPTSSFNKTRIVRTDSNGNATISPVRTGDKIHTVVVKAPGYNDYKFSKYMSAWTSYNFTICMDPTTPPTTAATNTSIPPTDTPKPPQSVVLVTDTPTQPTETTPTATNTPTEPTDPTPMVTNTSDKTMVTSPTASNIPAPIHTTGSPSSVLIVTGGLGLVILVAAVFVLGMRLGKSKEI